MNWIVDNNYLNKNRNYNKSITLKNIRILLKGSDKTLEQIEKNAGCEPGYMTTLEAPGNTTDPSIEFLMTASKELGVSLDLLVRGVRGDYYSGNEYIERFLQKLYQDLLDEKLSWEAINDAVLDLLDFKEDDPWLLLLEKPDNDKEYSFISESFGENTFLKDESFKISLPGKVTIFLMNVASDDLMYDPDCLEDTECTREVWMVTDDGMKTHLCSNAGFGSTGGTVDIVYEHLENLFYSPELEQSVIDALEVYMTGTKEKGDYGC